MKQVTIAHDNSAQSVDELSSAILSLIQRLRDNNPLKDTAQVNQSTWKNTKDQNCNTIHCNRNSGT